MDDEATSHCHLRQLCVGGIATTRPYARYDGSRSVVTIHYFVKPSFAALLLVTRLLRPVPVSGEEHKLLPAAAAKETHVIFPELHEVFPVQASQFALSPGQKFW